MRICIIDDEHISRTVLDAMLKRHASYDVETFPSAVRAIVRCKEITFDLILVDYQMPEMNGIECIMEIRRLHTYAHVPMIMLTADVDRDVRLAAINAGATDFLNKPFDREELRIRVKNLLSLREAQLALIDRAQTLDEEVHLATRKLVEREEELIWRLSLAIETRDGSTGEHISRVATVSELIARAMKLPKAFCRTIYLAAPLHDTGKIGISDAILNKPSKLTPEERQEIERHTEIGAQILENGESDLIRMAHEIALYHHEKWDGTGYGHGLAGEAIPLSARIVAVADVLDALLALRTYKPPWSFEDGYNEILQQSGKHFDPDCVEALRACIGKVQAVYDDQIQQNHVA